MRNIWTIAKRDFKSYFTSPIGYIIIALFMVITAKMFNATLGAYIDRSAMFQAYGKGPNIHEGIFRPVFGNMNVILLFVVPFITMRLFAEEKKQHTLELLITAPITMLEIIFGKFLSSVLVVLAMLLPTLVYPLVVMSTASLEIGPIFTSYLGTLLLSTSYMSLGILYSAMTDNQIIAAALGLFSILFFWLISWGAQAAGPVWGDVMQYASLITHFENFSQGVISTPDIIYYISFIGIGLFLTHRTLDSYRWR
ncbi:MAG: ABC transporter permease subunit [Bdellovibrio sp.]|nr:ABC transporter permease subunit [Bdellovibrio sp.]